MNDKTHLKEIGTPDGVLSGPELLAALRAEHAEILSNPKGPRKPTIAHIMLNSHVDSYELRSLMEQLAGKPLSLEEKARLLEAGLFKGLADIQNYIANREIDIARMPDTSPTRARAVEFVGALKEVVSTFRSVSIRPEDITAIEKEEQIGIDLNSPLPLPPRGKGQPTPPDRRGPDQPLDGRGMHRT